MAIGSAKIMKKVEYLKGHFWEAIQAMWVKFLFNTYAIMDYHPHTEFRPILRRSYGAKIRC